MTKGTQLTNRDFQILQAVGRFKFLTTFQLQKLFFPTGNHRTASNRLATLTRYDVLSRLLSYPKATQTIGHPTAIYYYSPRNQTALKNYLEKNGLVSSWENFENLPATPRDQFSQLFIVHETGISEFFLALEKALPKENLDLVFWERTSPFSKEITTTIPVRRMRVKKSFGQTTIEPYTEYLHLNPDAIFCLKRTDTEAYFFFFFEFDNNTAPAPKCRKKLEGYIEYRKQKNFPQLLSHYVQKYKLPIQNTERASFRVLTITPDQKRRDNFLLQAINLKSYKMFLFSALTDITPEKILSPVWVRGKEFSPYAQELKALERKLTPAQKNQWILEKLPAIAPVPLEHEN